MNLDLYSGASRSGVPLRLTTFFTSEIVRTWFLWLLSLEER